MLHKNLRLIGLVLSSFSLLLSVISTSESWARQVQASKMPNSDTSEADLIFQCDFEQSAKSTSKDLNYDDWPDLWNRKKGRGYPAYSTIKIQPHSESKNQRALFIGLDGGRAAVFSPKIPVSGNYSYVLNGLAKSAKREGHNCSVHVTLEYMDKDGQVVKQDRIEPSEVEGPGKWRKITTKLLAIESEDITHLVIGLHVEPIEETSLFGKAWFDEISLFQRPRIQMDTGHPLNIFTDPTKMVLRCNVTGARKSDAGLLIELYDEHGKKIRSTKKKLKQIVNKATWRKKKRRSRTEAPNSLIWKLVEESEKDPRKLLKKYRGYYRIVITLLDRDSEQLVRELSFVVLDPGERASETMYGWTIPEYLKKVDADVLATSFQRLGINWIKMPIWLDPEDHRNLEFHSTMIQKIVRRGVEVVGVLDTPPPSVYKKYWQQEQGMAALTNDVRSFLTSIEPVLSQLRIRIARWQIGSDDDTSLAESNEKARIQSGESDAQTESQLKMKKITEFFLKYGEETKVGLPWIWLSERPTLKNSAWHFNSTIGYPELSASEMKNYVDSMPMDSKKEHWISIQPLSKNEYSLLTRVRDLTERFVEVKRLGIQRVFVPKPFEKHHGFFDERGMPTEVLVPWQILCKQLNGAEYLGPIQLPGGSVNQLFSKNGEAFMLIWNDKPTTETLYLGKRIQAIDLWGRPVAVERSRKKDVLYVNSWPVIVSGLDLQIAKIRRSVVFDRTSLASVTGRKQPLELKFRNYFQRGVSGSISLRNETIFNPEVSIPFKVSRDTDFKYTVPVRMGRDSLTGEQLVKLDFKFHYQELQPFSAWHPLHVGLENVEFAVRSKMNERGHFVMKITCINRSNSSISYSVYLFVPGRRRTSMMFLDVRPGQESKNITIYNTKELVGREVWIRAQEARGQRTLNYRVPIEK